MVAFLLLKTKKYSVDEIKDAELSEPVNYSKNVPVLKFRSEDKYKIYKYVQFNNYLRYRLLFKMKK